MKPLPEADIAPAIADCIAGVKEARDALTLTLQRVQEACEHRIVYEAPYRSPNMNAERICAHCRLGETGSHWSGGGTWSRDGFQPSVLGNEPGRLVLNVDRDELWALRVAP